MKKGSNDSLWKLGKSIKVNSNAVYLLNDLFCKFFKKKIWKDYKHWFDIWFNWTRFNLYKSENFELEPDYIYNKFGMIGLTKYFASKYGKENITINTISPGGIFCQSIKKFYI